MKRAQDLLTLFIILVLTAACSSGGGSGNIRDKRIDQDKLQAFLQDRPKAFHPYYTTLIKQGERNAVLNYLRLGLELMKHGEYAESEAAFDQAIRRISTIYADNKNARKARQKFTAEYIKDFKGDPYERAMAFFYRGLLFLEKDDYENARAAMLGGLAQDAMAENAEYAGDFALLYYLAGWASQCNGDRDYAEELFEQAIRLNPNLRRPEAEDNLLYLAFVNSGPVKKRKGKHNEQLYYARSWPPGRDEATRDYAIDLVSRGQPVPLMAGEDVYFQAATRGGRAVDVINAGKAQFKDTTEAAGEALTTTGVATMAASRRSNNTYNSDMATVGAGLAVLGVISSIASSNTKPEADIRYWDNLPEFIYVGVGKKQPEDEFLGAHDLRITLFDASGRSVPQYTDVRPHVYFNEVRHDNSCDWIGVEPYKRPLPTAHINR